MVKIPFEFLEQRLSKIFCLYSTIVSKCPAPFIVLPIVISLSMGLGFVWRLDVIKDDLTLYTPTDGRAKEEKQSLNRFFNLNDSDPYFVERRIDNRRSGYILVLFKNHTENVLNETIFEEIYKFWTSLEKISVDSDGKLWNYSDLCVLTEQKSCVKSPLLILYSMSRSSLNQIKYPVHHLILPFFPPKVVEIFIGSVIGGVTLDLNNVVTHANAVLLPYQLKYSNSTLDKLGEAWETILEETLENFQNDKLSLYWWTSETVKIETSKETQLLLKLLVPMFVLVTTFTVGCCFVNNLLRSKPWLGLCGVISAVLSIVSAMGLLLLSGVKLTSVTFFVPFITFSVGVDNVFILIAAWRKTNVYSSVSDRMEGSFRDAAVSITVTSLTDAVSFGVGCMSNFPSVKNFCLYACVAIMFVYFYQLTFFAGCMVLSGIREKQFRNCLTLKVIPTSSKTKLENDGISDHAAARFFRWTYASFLLHPITKCSVFLALFIYLGVAIWGVTRLIVGVYPADLLPAHSRSRETLRLTDKYFSNYSDTLHLWFTNLSKRNYTLPFWTSLDNEVKRFENTDFSDVSDSWYRAYDAFLKSENSSTPVSSEVFVLKLKNVFVRQQLYFKYSRDVVFGENNTIETVRFAIRLKRITFTNQYAVAKYFRNLADRSNEFDVHVYQDFFEFADQFDAIVPSIVSSMIVGSLAVILASLLLIPKPMCSIWVCTTIVSINVGIFGYMSLWGVHLDFISMVTIIMSIGASVDFSAHIAYHFAKEQQMTAEERVRASLYVVGTPIVQSAFSTLLGIVLITVVDSYTFRSFVKTSFLVIVFGMLHGLIVLPVLLVVFHCDNDCSSCVNKKPPDGSNDTPLSNHVHSFSFISVKSLSRAGFQSKVWTSSQSVAPCVKTFGDETQHGSE